MAKTKAKPRKPRNQAPTAKQAKAIEIWVEDGRTKSEALRKAGYSEAIAMQPGKVFNSPAVQCLLDAAGINPVAVLEQLNRKVYARKIEHITFPLYNVAKAKARAKKAKATDNISEQIRGEQLTDEDIRFMLGQQGIDVLRIVHGLTGRQVYYWAENHVVNLEAIEKVNNLFGLYAPKKVEGKHLVGVGTLSELRQKARENNVNIIDSTYGGDTGEAGVA